MQKSKWEIVEMDRWNVEQDYFIEFDGKGYGSFHFLCVDADLDYKIDKDEKKTEFSFEGNDEMDPISGRGWVKIYGSELHGHLYFHRGDDSGFKAKKIWKSN